MSGEKRAVYAIINPISGVGSKRKIPKMIEDLCKEHGKSLTVLFTEYANHASELTRRAVGEGAEVILAVGGDGTVNEIAQAMLNTDAILGIIPKGSGNGLARELRIPMDVKGALEVIFSGQVSVIDSCKANGRVFFCTCGVGFDAAVSEKFVHEKLRGSLTYIKNTVEEYLSYRPEVYELLADNQAINEKAFLVVCANASQYGNNAFIAPHADIQDGKMDLTILAPFTPLDIPQLAVQLFTKQIGRNSKIRSLKARNVTIIRQKPGMMHIDGEPVMAGRQIDIQVMPQTLKVFTPHPGQVSFTDEVYNFFGQVTRFFDKNLPYIFR